MTVPVKGERLFPGSRSLVKKTFRHLRYGDVSEVPLRLKSNLLRQRAQSSFQPFVTADSSVTPPSPLA